MDEKNAIEYLVSFDCDYDCDGCPFNGWNQDPDSYESYCSGEYGESSIKNSDLRKNVFLTRAAAEAALALRMGKHNGAEMVMRNEKNYPARLLNALRLNDLLGTDIDYENLTEDQIKGADYILSLLTEREKIVLDLYYKSAMSRKWIAERYNLSEKRVRQIIDEALKKLQIKELLLYAAEGFDSHKRRMEEQLRTEESKFCMARGIDPAMQTQTITVNPADTQTVKFYNEPLCSLTLTKRDSVTGKPVPDTEFTVKDANGNEIGRYTTGEDGTAVVTGLIPGAAYVVAESKVPNGYVLNTTPQTITVKNGGNTLTSGSGGASGAAQGGSNGGNHLDFENDPKTTLVIQKYIAGTNNEPLSGVEFLVTDSSGAVVGTSNGRYITDKDGRIVIEGLEPGQTITARETRTVDGYVLDAEPQSIKIKTGEAQSMTFWNKKAGTLVIRKLDKLTNAPLTGAEFELTYAEGGYVDDANGHLSSKGMYTTDAKGEIRISGITGTVVVKETKPANGYVIDQSTQTQTVTVNPQDTQTLTFLNEPLCSLTLTKLDSVTGKPVPNTEFTVKDGNGNVLGRYTTGKDGTAVVTGLIPNSTVVVSESRVPDGYVLNTTPQTIIVRNGANTLNSAVAGTTGGGTGSTGGSAGTAGSGNGLTFLLLRKKIQAHEVQGIVLFAKKSRQGGSFSLPSCRSFFTSSTE